MLLLLALFERKAVLLAEVLLAWTADTQQLVCRGLHLSSYTGITQHFCLGCSANVQLCCISSLLPAVPSQQHCADAANRACKRSFSAKWLQEAIYSLLEKNEIAFTLLKLISNTNVALNAAEIGISFSQCVINETFNCKVLLQKIMYCSDSHFANNILMEKKYISMTIIQRFSLILLTPKSLSGKS